MLRGECSLGRSVVAALLFTKSPNSSELGNETMVSKSILNSFYTFPVISLDLVNLLACHYKHIQVCLYLILNHVELDI